MLGVFLKNLLFRDSLLHHICDKPKRRTDVNFKRLAVIFFLAANLEAYEDEDDYDETVHENDNKNVYMEIPAIGNGFAFLYPSRIFSAKIELTNRFGMVVEPIIGHNVIRGIGATAGFYIRNGKNHNGLKYAFIDIERHGAVHEFFYDYDRYLRTTPGINLRYGFSAGVGVKQFSENRQEENVKIEYGPTFRLHLDLSYLIKYN